MRRIRNTTDLQTEAVKQDIKRGHAVVEVEKRLDISEKTLYVWLKQSH
jgi:transposase-like protein